MSGLLRRGFALPLEVRDVAGEGDGLTVFGRIVPYGETTAFRDFDGALKRERFIFGAFRDMARYIHRVKLAITHEGGYEANVGYGSALEERDDGAYSTFKLYRENAEKARDHLATTHSGLSVEFYSLDHVPDADGVIERRLARLYRVAAVEDPAYVGAKVLAIREQADEAQPAEPIGHPNLDEARAILAEMRRSAS